MKTKLSILSLLLSAAILSGCGKTETETAKKDEKVKSPAVENTTEIKQQTEKSDIKNDAALTTVEIKCSGMTCTSCEKTIQSKISKLEGVKEVNADHTKQLVKVSFETGKTSRGDIENTINAAGYKCEKE